jgi:FeS assembly SUF system regulator
MVRISKLTDYGIVIMALFAGSPTRLFQAREISNQTQVALPTVSKLLKSLTRHKFLTSLRGVTGGYQLATSPNNITIVDLIRALEGPIAITECSLGHDHCTSEALCTLRAPWLHINRVIIDALNAVKLSDLANSNPLIGEHQYGFKVRA